MIKLAFWDFKQVQHKLGCVATWTSYRQINHYIENKLIRAMPQNMSCVFTHTENKGADQLRIH